MTRKVTKGVFYKCPKCGGCRVEYSERFMEKRSIVFDSTGTRGAGTRRGRDRILEQRVTEQMTQCVNCKYFEMVPESPKQTLQEIKTLRSKAESLMRAEIMEWESKNDRKVI